MTSGAEEPHDEGRSGEVLPMNIVTAVLPEGTGRLAEAARSVRATEETFEHAGSELAWHLVVDGPGRREDLDPIVLSAAASVTILGRQYGLSVARNVALTRCEHPLTMPLDGDDLLHASTAAQASRLLAANANIGWVSGETKFLYETKDRLHPEEGRRQGREDGTAREWPAGSLQYRPERPCVGDEQTAFCPNAAVIRTELILKAGGWPASPAAEDKALLLRVSRMAGGQQLAETLLTYRIWGNQMTSTESYADMIAVGARFNMETLSRGT